MGEAEVSITINRSVEDVFAVISNFEHNAEWSSATVEDKITSPGPIGVGASAHLVSKFLGRRIENDAEITEFEPNRRVTMRSTSGPIPFRGSMTLDPVEGGTRVKATFELEPGGFFKVAEPIVTRMAKRQFESDLANLKDLMEAHAL
ncbi:MAG TPA: SRPBCC family protein [Candidatus Limnocylindria bacterium]|nr:SRPBCC family protein [Candidatus Limnocylindria bacterium]